MNKSMLRLIALAGLLAQSSSGFAATPVLKKGPAFTGLEGMASGGTAGARKGFDNNSRAAAPPAVPVKAGATAKAAPKASPAASSLTAPGYRIAADDAPAGFEPPKPDPPLDAVIDAATVDGCEGMLTCMGSGVWNAIKLPFITPIAAFKAGYGMLADKDYGLSVPMGLMVGITSLFFIPVLAVLAVGTGLVKGLAALFRGDFV